MTVKTLVSPAEVAEIAFGANPGFDCDLIAPTTILAAQEKFLRPVLGRLYGALERGGYTLLLEHYIKPPLAVLVKLLLLPSLAVRAGNNGLTRHRSVNFVEPAPAAVYDLHAALREEADLLLRRAVNHIEENLADFPEYDPAENVMSGVSIKGDIIF